MADLKTNVNPLFLREEELRQGIEMLFFAYRDFTAQPDEILEEYGFGRAHHRVIYFVGRNPRITVTDARALSSSARASKIAASGCFISPKRAMRWKAA